jgi:hypothetical protein
LRAHGSGRSYGLGAPVESGTREGQPCEGPPAKQAAQAKRTFREAVEGSNSAPVAAEGRPEGAQRGLGAGGGLEACREGKDLWGQE